MKKQLPALYLESTYLRKKETPFRSVEQKKGFDEKILDLLRKAFMNSARMYSLIGKNAPNFKKKVGIILSYTFVMSKRLKGIFFSSNEKTVMLFYRNSEFKHSFKDYINYLKIVLFCIPPSNILRAFLREKKIKSLREKKEDYLYVWFLAQEPGYDKLDGLLEAKVFLLNKAQELKLPILVETTEKRLLILYRRLGFDIYRTWEDKKTGMKVWFAKKEIQP